MTKRAAAARRSRRRAEDGAGRWTVLTSVSRALEEVESMDHELRGALVWRMTKHAEWRVRTALQACARVRGFLEEVAAELANE